MKFGVAILGLRSRDPERRVDARERRLPLADLRGDGAGGDAARGEIQQVADFALQAVALRLSMRRVVLRDAGEAS